MMHCCINNRLSAFTGKTGAISHGAQHRGSSKFDRGGMPLGKVGWQARGGPGRSVDILMELQLNKVHRMWKI